MDKKQFSIPAKKKQLTKKALDHFDQHDQKIDGDAIRGGNWTEYGGGSDKDEKLKT